MFASENWMVHGAAWGDTAGAAVWDVVGSAGVEGCCTRWVAYQSFEVVLVPTMKLTGCCGEPPARSTEERLNFPMVKTAVGDAACALDGMGQRSGRVQKMDPKSHAGFIFIVDSNVSISVARACSAKAEELDCESTESLSIRVGGTPGVERLGSR